MPEDKDRVISKAKNAYDKKRKEVIILMAGIAFLIASVPIFLIYNMFPTINSEIGPHQISSWMSVTFSFIGFGLILYAMGKLDI